MDLNFQSNCITYEPTEIQNQPDFLVSSDRTEEAVEIDLPPLPD